MEHWTNTELIDGKFVASCKCGWAEPSLMALVRLASSLKGTTTPRVTLALLRQCQSLPRCGPSSLVRSRPNASVRQITR